MGNIVSFDFGNRDGLTMSSREIADLCEKQHKNVVRDIKKMVEDIGIDDVLKFERIYFDTKNREQTEYRLPKDLTMTLVAGYDAKLRYKVIKRLEELEARNPVAVPNFSNPAEAARAWAAEYEARQLAERTKAEIGSRREATAMNTASQAVKKANELEKVLDRSQEYATIKRMSMLYHGQSFSWRDLKSVSQEMEIPPVDVFDANYGTVKAYHRDVWQEAYALDIPE